MPIIPVISGGIFNFTETGYSPPTYSGAVYEFGINVRQIWSDENYIYTSTVSGLNVYDIDTERTYAYALWDTGFNTVWANDDRVFVGTIDDGIKYINKSCINGDVYNPYNITSCLNDFSGLTYYSTLTSDNIRYIHGYNDVLLCITISGIDVVKLDPQSIRSYTVIDNGYKGFMTSTGKFYYVISASGITNSLHIKNNYLTDWTYPDSSYIVGSGIFESGITLNDIFVVENTATDGSSNMLYIATSSGIYTIDESNDEYNTYYLE